MDKSIQTHGWKIRSNHRPILGEEGHDALVFWLGDEEGELFSLPCTSLLQLLSWTSSAAVFFPG